VQNILSPSLDKLAALEAKITEDKLNKTVRSKSEWVHTLLGVARQNIDVEQWGQAVEKIETVRSLVAELGEVCRLTFFNFTLIFHVHFRFVPKFIVRILLGNIMRKTDFNTLLDKNLKMEIRVIAGSEIIVD
jgi:hypothetical protein